ncbi:hypothetical protein ACFL2T_00990 [Elusimicrobiota bacterium]
MSDSVRSFRPGVSCDEEGRYRRFTSRGVLVISLWSRPFAVMKTRARPFWCYFRPRVDLRYAEYPHKDPRSTAIRLSKVGLSPETDLWKVLENTPRVTVVEFEEGDALRRCALAVPESVRKTITARYRDRHFHLLSLVGRCPGALELCETNAALAYMWASSWIFKSRPVQRPLRSARSWMRKPQREQLRWLDFAPTEAMRRILGKVVTLSMTVPRLLALRRVCRDPKIVRRLSFLPRVSDTIVRLLSDPSLVPHLSHGFLAEMGWEEPSVNAADPWVRSRGHPLDQPPADVVGQMRETLQMARIARGGRESGIVFRDVGHLEKTHNELAEGLSRRGHGKLLDIALPPAPLANMNIQDVVRIEALSTPTRIIKWGRSQANCIGPCYLRSVAEDEGRTYLYRLLFPEEATLLIKRDQKGRYGISSLQGARNIPASKRSWLAVRYWLREAQKSTPDEPDENQILLWADD